MGRKCRRRPNSPPTRSPRGRQTCHIGAVHLRARVICLRFAEAIVRAFIVRLGFLEGGGHSRPNVEALVLCPLAVATTSRRTAVWMPVRV